MKRDYKQQYNQQKAGAKKRGIEWQLSFDEWLEFWGEDIDKRGRGHDQLCMQRFHDQGPYHPSNVKKGYAKQNMKTAGVIKRANNAKRLISTKQTEEEWEIVHKAYLEAA